MILILNVYREKQMIMLTRIKDCCLSHNSNWRYAMITEARTKSQLIIRVQVTFGATRTFCIKLLMRASLRDEFLYRYE